MTNLGLPVDGIVNVQIVMTPVAAATRNFGSLLIVGNSNVITVAEAMRLYSSIDAVATDFGTTAPEYKAARLYFGQTPQPSSLYIGRWATSPTSAVLLGGVRSTAQQLMSAWTPITNGSFDITIDRTLYSISSLDFSSQTTMNGIAAVISARIVHFSTQVGTCVWDSTSQRFVISSITTGTASTISYGSSSGSGTDISVLAGLVTGVASVPVQGSTGITAAAAVAGFINASANWYGICFAASVMPDDAAIVAVAGLIEAANPSRIFGVTTQEPLALDATSSADVASQLKALNYKRTFVQYSSSNPYAATSIFGRAFTVNFDGSNTTLTIKFKQEPGVVAETLTVSQAAALKAKSCNVFVKYNNGTSIIQEGVMSNGFFFDEVHGTDWQQNDAQTEIYNGLYTSSTKIPQTDPGVNTIVALLTKSFERGVANGLIAPGVWNADGFGALSRGDTLTKGYYIYAAPVATQSQANREARKAPVIQAAIKLAGAIHFVSDLIVNVNR